MRLNPARRLETCPSVVPGTPTGVFAQVARGVLGCWFGAGGPLKASHVTAPKPSRRRKAGTPKSSSTSGMSPCAISAAPRAYRISFASEARACA